MTFSETGATITAATLENTTNFFRLNTTAGTITIDLANGTTKTFTDSRFILRSPSEHTFSSKNYDLELQLIHTSTTSSETTHLSIFFDRSVGNGNTASDFINDTIPLNSTSNLPVNTGSSWTVSTTLL